jgi:hypothetical protein
MSDVHGKRRWIVRMILSCAIAAVGVATAGCGGGGSGGGGGGNAVKNIHNRAWVTAEVAKKSGRDVRNCTNEDANNVVPDTVAWICDVKSKVNSGYDGVMILFDANGKIFGHPFG